MLTHMLQARERRRGRRITPVMIAGFLAGLLTVVCVLFGTTWVGARSITPGELILLASVLAILATLAWLINSLRVGKRDWLAPAGFPFLYMAFVYLVPAAYSIVTTRPLGLLQTSEVNGTTVTILTLSLAGTAVGMWLGSLGRVGGKQIHAQQTDWHRVGLVCRILLLIPLGFEVYWAVTISTYGTNQLSFDLSTTARVSVFTLQLTSTTGICLANLRLGRRFPERLDSVLLGLTAAATLLSGTRFIVLSMVLVLLWASSRGGGGLKLSRLAGISIGIGGIFLSVLVMRSSTASPGLPGQSRTDLLLTDISSPLLIVSRVAAVVPNQNSFEMGSTYLAGLKRQLPSPIADSLFGPPTDTGSYVYRKLTGYYADNNGFGFALPAEGYLNFGYVGALTSGILVGWLLSWSYRRSGLGRSGLAYPLLLATWPFLIRADFLTQTKGVLYPLITLALVISASRTSERSASQSRLTHVIQSDVAGRDSGR